MMNEIDKTRILPIKGGYNFRDLGGLKNRSGKKIKKELLFRTDELSNLEPEDLDLLAELNIQTVIDFRTDFERAQSVDKLPKTCKNEIHLDILAANMQTFMDAIQKGTTDLKLLLLNFYKELVLSDNAIKEYSQFFKTISDSKNDSVIYHCTAGKDRTGVATALILSALDIDQETIMADYLLSNEFLKTKYQAYITQNPALNDVFLVQKEYLQTAFDAIIEKHETIENYLTNVLKVDLDLMKHLYLE